jgi:predicted Fe-S protein YdhL (DUF1289 family)
MKRPAGMILVQMFVLASMSVASADSLYSTDPWQSGFGRAVSEAEEAARPIAEARARWEQMTDQERAQMMGEHKRAFVRGGIYNPESETAAQARAKREKAANSGKKQSAGKKK